jgi:hypothetical protein
MNITVETKCKFCRRDIEMQVNKVGFENPAIDAKLWLKHVSCNRCATYHKAKRDICGSIGQSCVLLLKSRGDSKAVEIIARKLTVKTRELCKLVCDFKMVQFFWDQDFVAMLVEKPDKFSQILNLYLSRLNKLSEIQPQEFENP